MEEFRIRNLQHYLSLLKKVNSSPSRPSWEYIIPYYDENIFFKDSVQEIRGIVAFSEMTRRLAKRSRNLEMLIHSGCQEDNLMFIEWEMVISYKRYPKTSIFGVSSITLKEGKIIIQRDYYDLWGDIFNNMKFLARGYRRFMRKRFG